MTRAAPCSATVAHLTHERGEIVGVGGPRARLVLERQSLVELGEVPLGLGARGLSGGGVGLVFGGRESGLELDAGSRFGWAARFRAVLGFRPEELLDVRLQ